VTIVVPDADIYSQQVQPSKSSSSNIEEERVQEITEWLIKVIRFRPLQEEMEAYARKSIAIVCTKEHMAPLLG
jgi:hypothetical protein